MLLNKCKFWKVGKNKVIELQFAFNNGFADWFGFKLYTQTKCDHGGIRFEIELLKLIYFHIWFYDGRHWDYENDRWEVYED